jgi:hypothetical protein
LHSALAFWNKRVVALDGRTRTAWDGYFSNGIKAWAYQDSTPSTPNTSFLIHFYTGWVVSILGFANRNSTGRRFAWHGMAWHGLRFGIGMGNGIGPKCFFIPSFFTFLGLALEI